MAAITPKEDEENEEITKDDFMKNKSSMQIKNELEAGKDNPKMKSVIKAMTAEDIFTLFDEDGSGLISFPEFKRMLPYLEIHISDAKAFRYFNICDTDGSGEIDISPTAFLVSNCEQIYISGWGGEVNSNNCSSQPGSCYAEESTTVGLPLTADAFQSTTDGSDFYLCVLTPNAQDVLYASYLGGAVSNEHVDGGTSRFDKNGSVYHAVCAGCHSVAATLFSRTNCRSVA